MREGALQGCRYERTAQLPRWVFRQDPFQHTRPQRPASVTQGNCTTMGELISGSAALLLDGAFAVVQC